MDVVVVVFDAVVLVLVLVLVLFDGGFWFVTSSGLLFVGPVFDSFSGGNRKGLGGSRWDGAYYALRRGN
jgi:hypothetical protein